MKIINTGRPVKANEFADYLRQKLNPLFKERRQKVIVFDIENDGNSIEILQPQFYEGPLFRIEVDGTLLRVFRSEHYVDDVNSLTLESILSDLFRDVAGKYGTDLIQEG
jgi:hypothetical protein